MLFNKSGAESLMSLIIFLVLTVMFFMSLFIFVSRASNSHVFQEQIYSKKLALLIDEASPGMEIRLNVSDLKPALENMENPNEALTIGNGVVNVKLGRGNGYSFNYFSDYSLDSNVEIGGESAFFVIFIEGLNKEVKDE